MLKFIPIILAAMLAAAPVSAANLTQAQLQMQISAFKQSPDHAYVPQTLQRAEAYLGAAMLAAEQRKTGEAEAALDRAAQTLHEARQTAASFRKKFAAVITLRRDARTTLQVISTAIRSTGELTPQQNVDQGDRAFTRTIQTFEQGNLNQARSHADKAEKLYQRSLKDTLPSLLTLSARVAGKAAVAGAKRYAPRTYQAASDKLNQLDAYLHGKQSKMPEHPEEGLYLAREAMHMVEQVKLLRKNKDSHEKLILREKDLKLLLARTLSISEETDAMLSNISSRDLLVAIKKLNADLANERKAHADDVIRLKQQCEQEIEQRLTNQTDKLKQAQQNQMTTIKEAFKAKLERETFDSKRQQQLRKLFKKGEVEIFVNLDGSLLIRLVSLKFGSGKSKISSKYYDMLGRLKQAMNIYQERNLRIEGHTDDLGDVKPNQVLSLKRAEAVRDFLIAAGADGTRIKALGYGEVRPIASNEFPQGRAMNRRIDIVIEAAQ